MIKYDIKKSYKVKSVQSMIKYDNLSHRIYSRGGPLSFHPLTKEKMMKMLFEKDSWLEKFERSPACLLLAVASYLAFVFVLVPFDLLP